MRYYEVENYQTNVKERNIILETLKNMDEPERVIIEGYAKKLTIIDKLGRDGAIELLGRIGIFLCKNGIKS